MCDECSYRQANTHTDGLEVGVPDCGSAKRHNADDRLIDIPARDLKRRPEDLRTHELGHLGGEVDRSTGTR
jgi:hypothetical protein